MKSTKCSACGFVGWTDLEYCKACGTQLGQPEGQKNGLAIVALILGITSFFTFGLLGVGAITGIILAAVAMGRVKREPWRYGGRGMAIAGLVLSITSLVSLVPFAIIAAIAIPNLLAARMAANEASAIRSMQTISSAESVYYTTFAKYVTLDELGAQRLIDSKLANGSKDGYNFSIDLTTNEMNGEGFAVTGIPIEYRSSGRRSFYIDESMILRAGDNNGAPSTKADAPLEFGGEYPSRARRVEYQPELVY
jgi:type II secretory pathway pseudopilin PulG